MHLPPLRFSKNPVELTAGRRDFGSAAGSFFTVSILIGIDGNISDFFRSWFYPTKSKLAMVHLVKISVVILVLITYHRGDVKPISTARTKC